MMSLLSIEPRPVLSFRLLFLIAINPLGYKLFETTDCKYRMDIYTSILLSLLTLIYAVMGLGSQVFSLRQKQKVLERMVWIDSAIYVLLLGSVAGLVYLQYLSTKHCIISYWELFFRSFITCIIVSCSFAFILTSAILRPKIVNESSIRTAQLNTTESELRRNFKNLKGWHLFVGKYTQLKKVSLREIFGSGDISTAYISEYVSWSVTTDEAQNLCHTTCPICDNPIRAGHRVIPRFGKYKQPVHMHCQYSASAVLDQWTSYTLKLLYTMSKDGIENPKDLREHLYSNVFTDRNNQYDDKIQSNQNVQNGNNDRNEIPVSTSSIEILDENPDRKPRENLSTSIETVTTLESMRTDKYEDFV